MVEVAEEIFKFSIDVVALQGIRWSEHGKLVKKKDFSILYNVATKSGQRETGFLLTKRLRRGLLAFESINDRL